MLDKYQEKLFQSLPKPNLDEMDISALQKASEKTRPVAKRTPRKSTLMSTRSSRRKRSTRRSRMPTRI